MRRRFDIAYIRSELERVGASFDASIRVFLLGGGAMAFRDLKAATKDVDLVVSGGDDLRRLQAGLQTCGYDIVTEPGEGYDELGAQRILENDDGCRVDLFNRQVMDKLVLSGAMRQRSDPVLDAGGLSVALVSPEDIFLFKAVAGRTGDVEDMFALVQTDLDFDVIETELHRQIDLLDQELFVSYVNAALGDLDAQYNVTTPLADTVRDITARVYRELEVLQAFDESTTLPELRNAVDFTAEEVDEAVRRLQNKGIVTIENDRITKESTTL